MYNQKGIDNRHESTENNPKVMLLEVKFELNMNVIIKRITDSGNVNTATI